MNFISKLSATVQNRITSYVERKARLQAIRVGLHRATTTHPDYNGIGFDEQFLLQHKGAALMKPFLNGGALPCSNELTAAWLSQFHFSAESAQRATENVTPMITEFVYILANEVSNLSSSTAMVDPLDRRYRQHHAAELSTR